MAETITLRKRNKEIYAAWKAMKQRCLNPKCKAYKNYGKRGIAVCDEWMNFEPFCEWALSHGWEKGLDLDRTNNNDGYSPENCRWVSRKQNLNNRRTTIKITVDGITHSETEWSDILGIDRANIKNWLRTNEIDEVQRRIKEALQNGYWHKDYGYGSRKRIRHIESGIVFESVREAAKYVGLAPCTISNSMKNRDGKTGKGRFKWEDISDK